MKHSLVEPAPPTNLRYAYYITAKRGQRNFFFRGWAFMLRPRDPDHQLRLSLMPE